MDSELLLDLLDVIDSSLGVLDLFVIRVDGVFGVTVLNAPRGALFLNILKFLLNLRELCGESVEVGLAA